jgi:hypothetical protein
VLTTIRSPSVAQATNEPTDATADIYRRLMPIASASLIPDAMGLIGTFRSTTRPISVAQPGNEPANAAANIYRRLSITTSALSVPDAVDSAGIWYWQCQCLRSRPPFARTKCNEKRHDESHQRNYADNYSVNKPNESMRRQEFARIPKPEKEH